MFQETFLKHNTNVLPGGSSKPLVVAASLLHAGCNPKVANSQPTAHVCYDGSLKIRSLEPCRGAHHIRSGFYMELDAWCSYN